MSGRGQDLKAPPNPVIHADVKQVIDGLGAQLQKLSGTTLLVTGASGFLCSYFVDTIAALNDEGLQPPCKVIALDNLKTGLPERLARLAGRKDVQVQQHDVTRPLEPGRVDWIIHGASIASPTVYRCYPLETIDTNVSGTRRMLELARRKKAKSILYLSTSEVYGDPDAAAVPIPEAYRGNVSCTGPRACYDESKRLAETLCMTYYRVYGTPVKMVRPFNVYGPGQRLDDGRIIPDLMRSAVNRRPITLYSDGRASRAFCYASDALRAMWQVLLSDADGEVFNVGNDREEITIRQLAELLRQVAGPPWLEIRTGVSEDRDYLTDNPRQRCPDISKLRRRFKYEPGVSLSEGLRRTLQSYRKQSAREGDGRAECG